MHEHPASEPYPDSWNNPEKIRQRVLRVEAQRMAVQAETWPAPARPHPYPPARTRLSPRTKRPAVAILFVGLLGVGLLASLCVLSLFATTAEFCVDRGYRQECGTFGDIMESLTLMSPETWIVGLVLTLVYQVTTMYGVWTMRLWGWWLAVSGLTFNFMWSMCDMGIRVFVIWTLSGLLLLWFFRNKRLFSNRQPDPSDAADHTPTA